MKSSCILALATAATASAFAPSMPSMARSRTSLAGSSAQFDEILQTPEPEEPPLPIELTGPQYVKTLAGASAPFPYFDPLQISSKFRAIDVKKFRESEIKHARVAMLAFAGMFVQELAHPLFENGGKDLGPAIYHFQAVQNYFPLMPAILLVIVGICEGNNIYVGWVKQPLKLGVADLKPDYEPGSFGFDPLGLYPKDEAGKKAMMTKELNNGRLAMLATIGVWAQELVDGKTILGHLEGGGRNHSTAGLSTRAAADVLQKLGGTRRQQRRSIMGNKSQEIVRPEVVSVHVESTSTVLDDLRGQATWEEEWMDNNPNMVSVSNHERKVHLLSDLLGKADGVVAFKEVLQSSPALRALMLETGGAGGDPMAVEESKYRVVGSKLGESDKLRGDAAGANGGGENAQLAARGTSTQEFYHHRDRLRSLLEREENAICADCTAKLPTWASVNTGVFLCTQCAGCHRSLGVHISKVLSVQLDDWTADQVGFMAEMGNGVANSFLEYHVPSAWPKPSHLEPREYRDSYIKAKYEDRLFEFRCQKKPVIKPPPAVDMSLGVLDRSSGGALERRPSASQGMMEYIGFVNIVLVRGEDLVSAGFGQMQYMAVLRIGGQEVRSRSAKADGAPSWKEKLMLCWDGSMPLKIDIYGGKDHIGQAHVPLRKLLLHEVEDDDEAEDGDGAIPAPAAPASGLSPATRLLDRAMASPSSSHNGDNSSNFAAYSVAHDAPPQPHVERIPSKTPSPLSSSSGSEPPTLGSLSSAATTPVPPVRKTPTARIMNAPSSDGGDAGETSASTPAASRTPELSEVAASPAPAAGGGAGDGRGSGSSSRAPMSTSPPDVVAFAGNSFKPGSGRGLAGLLGKVKTPAEPTSSPIAELPGGELLVTLEDKKDVPAGDRFNGLSPMTGTGSVGSSRGPSPRPLGGMIKYGGSLNGSVNTSSKSFNSMIFKLGKGGGSSGGGGSAGQSQQSRPAQGGVVIKMDFVKIEH
eukprot:g8690.t2